MNRTAFTALALWGLSFICALTPLEAYGPEAICLSVLSLCTALALILARAPLPAAGIALPKSPLLWIGGTFWALALTSVLLSEIRFVSFLYFCTLSLFPLSALTFFILRNNQKPVITLFLALMGLLALTAVVQYFFMPDILRFGRAHWPLSNPNTFAGLLSLGFFGAQGWMLSARNRLHSNMALGLSLLLIAAILTTGSRGAIVALAGGFALMILLAGNFRRKHWRCLTLTATGTAALLAAINLFAADTLQQATSTRLVATATGTESVLYDRPHIWAASWRMMQDHLWSGTGIGTFFLYYPQYRAGDFTSAGLMAHNDPLQFGVEMGVLAPILFYLFAAGAFIRSIRALRACPPDDPRRIYVLAPLCALGALIAHAHISFHFHVPPTLIAGGGLLGFWLFWTGDILKDNAALYRFSAPPALLKTGLILALLAPAALFSAWQGSEIMTSRAQKAALSGDIERFATALNTAGKLSGNRNARALVMAASVKLTALEEGGFQMDETRRAALTQSGMRLLETAELHNPRLSDIAYNKARFTALSTQEESGQTAFFLRHALTLNPLHLPARRMLAALYDERGESAEAYTLLKDGL
ncbi:MAG: O-antigen ligase family protein, partial [Alphaproteobacteria bacterium]|nr:O-antigen ligase family protein [Alphaproteobacteria bacterium]